MQLIIICFASILLLALKLAGIAGALVLLGALVIIVMVITASAINDEKE